MFVNFTPCFWVTQSKYFFLMMLGNACGTLGQLLRCHYLIIVTYRIVNDKVRPILFLTLKKTFIYSNANFCSHYYCVDMLLAVFSYLSVYWIRSLECSLSV